MERERDERAALIFGAGIEGMAIALMLAEAGRQVCLLDRAPWIGGSLHLLDRTFPTDSCGLCLMSPGRATYCPTYQCALHRNIVLRVGSELVDVSTQEGRRTASVRTAPRFVDGGKCDLCGRCREACPVARPTPEDRNGRALLWPPDRAVPAVPAIDPAACTRCGRCVEVCPRGAIDLSAAAQLETLPADAIVLASGYEPFDPRVKGEYGYGAYPNVVTSVEWERMGQPPGRLRRPSDGKSPRRVAFIQCVGSRDLTCEAPFCSSVCCMYTARQAAAVSSADPETQVTVFHMDLRATGKGYERYLESVQALRNVRYCRSQVSRVLELRPSRNLRLTGIGEDGAPVEQDFDLVVLAAGLRPSRSMADLVRRLGVPADRFGFLLDDRLPGGVFIGGMCRRPMDVPEAMIDAADVGGRVTAYLGGAIPPPAPPGPVGAPESGQVAVILQRPGDEGGPVDLSLLIDYTAGLPHVAFVREVDCISGSIPEILATAESCMGLVLGGIRGPAERLRLEADLEAAGWPAARLAWAPGLLPHDIGTAVASLSYQPRRRPARQIEQAWTGLYESVLVVGGGPAGMSAAAQLAALGRPVCLVERTEGLGGQARDLRFLLDGRDPATLLAQVRAGLDSHLIQVHTGADLRATRGHAGRFVSTIRVNGCETEVTHGALIVATGGQPAATDLFGLGQTQSIMTQRELEKRLAERGGAPVAARSVVMIQCVGSRDDHRPWCSRICCGQAIKNALELKRRDPDVTIHVLYRDIRVAGPDELSYLEARRAGVRFLRYEREAPPTVRVEHGRPVVTGQDRLLGRSVELRPDWVALSVGLDPGDNRDLAGLLGLPLDEDGFWQQAHVKMRPADFERPGAYLCGLAHGPCSLTEAMSQGRAAASRAAAFLGALQRGDCSPRAAVNPRLCCGCELCITGCPYGARELDATTGKARVWAELCVGCGNCAAVCRNGASEVDGCEKGRLLAAVDAAL